jgi:hypothetical protein
MQFPSTLSYSARGGRPPSPGKITDYSDKFIILKNPIPPHMLNNYLKVGWRNIVRYKLYAVINILGMSIGICSSMVIFIIVRLRLNRCLPMPTFFRPLILLLLSIPLLYSGYAQTGNPDDSAFYRAALKNTIGYFYANSKSVCTCLRGKEYIASPYSFSEGSPYFLDADAREGSLVYDHVYYDSVRLLYDELQGDLVFVDERHRIMLLNEKVERFFIEGHQFINLGAEGYFQLLYEGNSMTLKKEEKKTSQPNLFSVEERVRVIDTKTVYYLRNGNHLYRIEGKRTFLTVWGNYQSEINEFIKRNKIKFRNELDGDYVRLTAFCDQLSPPK